MPKAIFTLYRIGFCSIAKVAPVQCEQELMLFCGAEIVPKRSQCEQKRYLSQFTTLPFALKKLFSKTRFCCNFCSDKSVHTWVGPFQKPIRYGTFHFQQWSGTVLFRSRNCFESSVPGVNRSPIWYTFCDAPFHCPVQCERGLICISSFLGCLLGPGFVFDPQRVNTSESACNKDCWWISLT